MLIGDTGKVTKTAVSQSSGFAELDQAAVACVTSEWHFSPATQNGKPVASTKQYRITWKLMDDFVPPRLKMDTDGLCETIFASAKNRWPGYHAATLQFRVSSIGAVELPFVAVSSGDSLFDAKAVECMSKRSYIPALPNGAPADVSWTAAVLWSPHTGLAFASGRDAGFFCPDNDFPASMWKGDPPNPTEISFQAFGTSFAENFAIEQESGNPELDQAALNCIKSRVQPLPSDMQAFATYGYLLRFTWRQGHAFILNLRGN